MYSNWCKKEKPTSTIHMDVCHYHKLIEIDVLLCMCYLTKEWRKHNFLNYADEDIIIDINYWKEGESSFCRRFADKLFLRKLLFTFSDYIKSIYAFL